MRNIPLTIFLTHKSTFLESKYDNRLFNFGIHPNFIKGSSQGNNYSEIINFCLDIYPEAKCYRVHRYYDVNDTVHMLRDKGFLYDSNLCTLLQDVMPFIHRSGLVRF